MPPTMNSRNAFLAITPSSDQPRTVHKPAERSATSQEFALVVHIQDRLPGPPSVPTDYVAIDDLVRTVERDDARRNALEEARQWAADALYPEDGLSIRAFRLRKGLSQRRLAECLGTSQSHVARIERGTENLMIETLRGLCAVLDVDMNTLDKALRQQEEIGRRR